MAEDKQYGSGSIVDIDRLIKLKTKVKAECLRRKYNGSVESYGGNNYDFNTNPIEQGVILKEHYTKNSEPLNAINQTNTPNILPKTINNEDIYQMDWYVTTYRAVAPNSTTENSCSNSCTGLCLSCTGTCANGCSNTCTQTCGWDCSSSCLGCSGSCQSCTGSCSGTCSNSCTGGCSGTCTITCGSAGCKGGCRTGCTGNLGCTGKCSTACGDCGSTCVGACTVSSSGGSLGPGSGT